MYAIVNNGGGRHNIDPLLNSSSWLLVPLATCASYRVNAMDTTLARRPDGEGKLTGIEKHQSVLEFYENANMGLICFAGLVEWFCHTWTESRENEPTCHAGIWHMMLWQLVPFYFAILFFF